jgi:hypothetical protein
MFCLQITEQDSSVMQPWWIMINFFCRIELMCWSDVAGISVELSLQNELRSKPLFLLCLLNIANLAQWQDLVFILVCCLPVSVQSLVMTRITIWDLGCFIDIIHICCRITLFWNVVMSIAAVTCPLYNSTIFVLCLWSIMPMFTLSIHKIRCHH